MAVWTEAGSGSFTGQGANNPTPVDIGDFSLPMGNYGVAIVMGSSTGHDYTNGNGVNQLHANADLSISAGTASNVPFTGGIFNPRVWNGTIYYSGAGNSEESYGLFGSGCPGSNGLTPALTAPPPVINANWTVTASDLAPNSIAFVLYGTSKTKLANGLPLPFDLSTLGTGAGCSLLCEPLIAASAPAISGVASVMITIPMLPGLLDTQIFNQAIVMDPLLTTGLTMCASNGGEGVIGQ
ncbi:MAG: hypothetical protein GY944_13960 [bacterium]|nr:hypothetical protein [bacterium]